MQACPLMIRTHLEPIEIHDAHFAGKRKYNHRRLLEGDVPAASEDGEVDIVNRRNHR